MNDSPSLSHTHTLDRWSFGVIMQICALMQDLESERNRLPCELEAVWFIWINLCCLFVLQNSLKCPLCSHHLKPATLPRCLHVQKPSSVFVFFYIYILYFNLFFPSEIWESPPVRYCISDPLKLTQSNLLCHSNPSRIWDFFWCMTWRFPPK